LKTEYPFTKTSVPTMNESSSRRVGYATTLMYIRFTRIWTV